MPEPIRVSTERAKELSEHQEVTFLDVIDTPSYDEFDVQIEGAVRIKPEKIGEQYEQLSKDRTILTY